MRTWATWGLTLFLFAVFMAYMLGQALAVEFLGTGDYRDLTP